MKQQVFYRYLEITLCIVKAVWIFHQKLLALVKEPFDLKFQMSSHPNGKYCLLFNIVVIEYCDFTWQLLSVWSEQFWFLIFKNYLQNINLLRAACSYAFYRHPRNLLQN